MLTEVTSVCPEAKPTAPTTSSNCWKSVTVYLASLGHGQLHLFGNGQLRSRRHAFAGLLRVVGFLHATHVRLADDLVFDLNKNVREDQ